MSGQEGRKPQFVSARIARVLINEVYQSKRKALYTEPIPRYTANDQEVSMNGELEHLQRRLKGLTLKRSSLAFGLWGEAGIGKTHRTLDLLRATPCRTVTVHATQDFECTARALPRPKKASVWLERFIERIERGEHLTSEQHLELLAALLTSNAPIVLHIEDIHEADPERLEFWQRLASSQTQTRGVGLLVTSRTHPPEGFEVIRLLSLVREDSDRLLEIEAGATLPSDALGWIFDRAAGNPLFTLEFFRFLSRQGFLWNDGKRWRWREPERQVLPGTVEALIEQGIARVASQDSFKDILAAKAVLGRGVQRLPLAEVAGLTLEGLDTAMDALTVQGVLAEGEFAHPLYAEVVLRDVSQEKRRILAQRALKAFNDDPLIACTFVEDASLASEQMLTMFKRAALRAKVLRNETLANQFLVKAANHASGQEKGRLALEAAKALKGSDLPTAIRLGEVSLQLMPQNIQAIDLLARIFAYRRDHEKLSWVLEQLPEAEKGKLGLTIQVEVFSILNDHQSVLELVKHNPGLLESDPDTLYNIAWSMLGFGQHEEARDLIAQARERPTLRVDQRARFSYLQAIIFATHEVSNLEAEHFFRQALEGFRESGKVNNIIAGLHAHATVLQDLGMYREAMLELQESAQLSIKRGNIVQYAQNNIAIADHLAWSGNYEQAETLYLESLDILRRHEPDDFLIDCLSSLSALYRMWESTYNLTLANASTGTCCQGRRAPTWMR